MDLIYLAVAFGWAALVVAMARGCEALEGRPR